ncbi:MAG: peptidylprolyl isomerase [Bacteroidales bacterium]|nr:peptidylprolyl isomerase [Bacteroidales bacterium]
MIINLNKYTAISYTLKSENAEGKTIETVDHTKPVEFIFGQGSLLPAFENHLNGLQAGDKYEFTLVSEEAYGVFKKELLVELNKDMFAQNGVVNEQLLTIGNQIPMQDSQGNRLNGIVKELKDDKVMMDFNHPLAGQDLYFAGQVESVREATYDELNPPAHQGCGCGSNEGSCSTEPEHAHDHADEGCGCGNSSCGC